jgi:hypothetical protein
LSGNFVLQRAHVHIECVRQLVTRVYAERWSMVECDVRCTLGDDDDDEQDKDEEDLMLRCRLVNRPLTRYVFFFISNKSCGFFKIAFFFFCSALTIRLRQSGAPVIYVCTPEAACDKKPGDLAIKSTPAKRRTNSVAHQTTLTSKTMLFNSRRRVHFDQVPGNSESIVCEQKFKFVFSFTRNFLIALAYFSKQKLYTQKRYTGTYRQSFNGSSINDEIKM